MFNVQIFATVESTLGTMVINESSENTKKQYGTVPGQGAYRQVSLVFFFISLSLSQTQKLGMLNYILGQTSWMHLRRNLSLHQPQQGKYPASENGNDGK